MRRPLRRPRRLTEGVRLERVPLRRLVFELPVGREALVRVEEDWEEPWQSVAEARAAPRGPARVPLAAAALLLLVLLGAALATPAADGSLHERVQERASSLVSERLAPALGWLSQAPFARPGATFDAEGTDGEPLETSSRVELVFAEPARAQGFLVGRNLAPGDRSAGELVLATRADAEQAQLWLRVELRPTGPSDGFRLEDDLVVTRLAYADADVPVPAEADEDSDGRLSLRELAKAVLPTLAPPAASGTPLAVEVVFDPHEARDGRAYEGQSVEAVFVFTLVAQEVQDAR